MSSNSFDYTHDSMSTPNAHLQDTPVLSNPRPQYHTPAHRHPSLPPIRSIPFSSATDNISHPISQLYTPTHSHSQTPVESTHSSYRTEHSPSPFQSQVTPFARPEGAVARSASYSTQVSPSTDVEGTRPSPTSNLDHAVAPPMHKVIDAVAIDTFAQDFKLTKQQRLNLHGFVEIGSRDPPLSRPDLGTRLYLLAAIYGLENENNRREQARSQGAEDYKGMLDDMKVKLSSSAFELTAEQKSTVRSFLQDRLFQKNRTSFCKIHRDTKLKEDMKREKATLKLTNVFGDATQERRFWSQWYSYLLDLYRQVFW
ncbi:hypothetical protein K435DRAFT_810658 [Dendrothele bispora CBS 962.96]|uniref:Uncharacterized protein n=1 Tax=Dendrothele bispora (strain CBS 962.96) TaxID=1314807 RepID=A0A4S8KUE4_DENBC|nr:hypothetical protein K435DRAFT_810658 [Dendrothele bispora CBS 962.96]